MALDFSSVTIDKKRKPLDFSSVTIEEEKKPLDFSGVSIKEPLDFSGVTLAEQPPEKMGLWEAVKAEVTQHPSKFRPGEIGDRFKNMVTRILAPAAFLTPGVSYKELMKELDEESAGFTGGGARLIPALAYVSKTANEYAALSSIFAVTGIGSLLDKVGVKASSMIIKGEIATHGASLITYGGFKQFIPRVVSKTIKALPKTTQFIGLWRGLDNLQEGKSFTEGYVKGVAWGAVLSAAFPFITETAKAGMSTKAFEKAVTKFDARFPKLSTKMKGTPKDTSMTAVLDDLKSEAQRQGIRVPAELNITNINETGKNIVKSMARRYEAVLNKKNMQAFLRQGPDVITRSATAKMSEEAIKKADTLLDKVSGVAKNVKPVAPLITPMASTEAVAEGSKVIKASLEEGAEAGFAVIDILNKLVTKDTSGTDIVDIVEQYADIGAGKELIVLGESKTRSILSSALKQHKDKASSKEFILYRGTAKEGEARTRFWTEKKSIARGFLGELDSEIITIKIKENDLRVLINWRTNPDLLRESEGVWLLNLELKEPTKTEEVKEPAPKFLVKEELDLTLSPQELYAKAVERGIKPRKLFDLGAQQVLNNQKDLVEYAEAKLIKAKMSKNEMLRLLKPVSQARTYKERARALKAINIIAHTVEHREAVADLDKVLKKIKKSKTLDKYYGPEIVSLLKDIDLGTRRKNLFARLERFASSADFEKTDLHDILKTALQGLPNIPLKKFDAGEITLITNVIKLMNFQAKAQKTFYDSKGESELSDVVNIISNDILSSKTKDFPDEMRYGGLWPKYRTKLPSFWTMMTSLGGEKGKLFEYFIERLGKPGEKLKAEMKLQAMDKVRAIGVKYMSKKEFLSFTNDAKDIAISSGKQFYLTKNDIASLWSMYQDHETRAAMVEDINQRGVLFPRTKQAKARSLKAVKLTEDELIELFGFLSDKDIAYADEMRKVVNVDFRKMMNDFEESRNGTRPYINETYYPRRAAKEYLEEEGIINEASDTLGKVDFKSIDEILYETFIKDLKLDHQSILLPRAKRAARPFVVIPLTTTVDSFISKATGYMGKFVSSEQMLKVVHDPMFRSAVRKKVKYSGLFLNELDDRIRSYTGLDMSENDFLSDLGHLTVKYAHLKYLWASFTVPPVQIISGANSFSLFNGVDVAKALVSGVNIPLQNRIYDEVVKRSPTLRLRFEEPALRLMTPEIGELSSTSFSYPGLGENVAMQAGYYPIKFFDRQTIKLSAMMPAYFEGKGLGLEGDALWEHVAERTEYAVDKAHPTWDSITASGFSVLAKKRGIYAPLIAFKSQVFKNNNMMTQAVHNYRAGDSSYKSLILQIATPLIINALLYTLLKHFIYRGVRGRPKKEKTWMDLGIDAAAVTLGTAFPIIGNVVGGVVATTYYRTIKKKPLFGYGLGIAQDIYEDLAAVPSDIGKIIVSLSEDKRLDEAPLKDEEKWVYDLYDFISNSTKAVNKPIGTLVERALPSQQKTTSFYSTMYYDAIKRRDREAAQVASDRLRSYGYFALKKLKMRVKKREMSREDFTWAVKNIE